MDIERLNKIKQICFTKDKQSKRKRQPSQQAKLPLETITLQVVNQGKENARFSKRSKSPTSNRGKKDLLKRYEIEVSSAYDKKQLKLEQNLKTFNDSNKRHRTKSNMSQLSDFRQRQSLSPLQATGSRTASCFKHISYQRDHSLPRPGTRSLSPCSVIKYQSPFSRECGGTSYFGRMSKIQIVVEPDEEFQGRAIRMRSLLLRLIDATTSHNSESLLTNQQIHDLRLRVTGSFDRLIQIEDHSKSTQLVSIIENCFNDLYNKITCEIKRPGQSNSASTQIKHFIMQLTQELAVSNIEDVLPDVVQSIADLKSQLSFLKLQNVITTSNSKLCKHAFCKLRQESHLKSLLETSIRHVIIKRITKVQQAKQLRAFNLWVHHHKETSSFINTLVQKKYNQYFKQIIAQAQDDSAYFKLTRELIKSILGQSFIFVDVIIVREDQGYSRMESSEEEVVIDMSHQSLLRQALSSNPGKKGAQGVFLMNILEKKDFNGEVDGPFTQKREQVIKESRTLDQVIFPVYSSNSDISTGKKLALIVRLTSKSQFQNQILPNQRVSHLMTQSGPMIIASWKSFKKLNRQFAQFTKKLESINDMSCISDKTLHQLQYIQAKTCESNMISTIPETFRLLEVIVKDLFNYDKIALLQYYQGQLIKLYDASKGGRDRQDLGYAEDSNERLIRDLVQAQNEGNLMLFKQELLESEDSFDMKGKCVKDYVVIAIDMVQASSETTLSGSLTFMNQSQVTQLQQSGTRHFVRLEKKLNKAKEQEDFRQTCDPSTIMRSFSQLCLISINKMLMLASQSRLVTEDSQLDNQEMTRVTQDNEELRRMLLAQLATDNLIQHLHDQDALKHFETLEEGLGLLIKESIPKCQQMKLFLCKDDQGQTLYTYTKGNPITQTFGNAQQDPYPQQQNKLRAKSHGGFQQKVLGEKAARQNLNVFANGHLNSQIPSQLDDISSISAGDGSTNTMGNTNGRLNLNTNNFQIDKGLHYHKRRQSLTRQVSDKFIKNSMAFSKHSQFQSKKNGVLMKDTSENQILMAVGQRQLSSNMTDLINEGTSHLKLNGRAASLSSYEEILNEDQSNEYEISSCSNLNDRQEIRPSQQSSILGKCILERQTIVKRNIKNDKSFNNFVDGLVLQGLDEQLKIQNSIYVPLVGSKQQLYGAIQVANCEKESYFEKVDVDIAEIIACKLSTFMGEQRERHCDRVMFKKQMDVSVLNTSLENNTVSKVLRLANQLFSSKLPPKKATGLFINKTETYLNKIFNCQHSQVLLIDSTNQEFLSVDYKHHNKLISRGPLTTQSIANSLLSNTASECFIHPSSGDYILIGDSDFGMSSCKKNLHSSPSIFNPKVDLPLAHPLKSEFIPRTYIAVAVRTSRDQVLAIVQLMLKTNGQGFIDQEIRHLQLVGEHISQVFSHVYKIGFLQQIGTNQEKAAARIISVLSNKYKSYGKQLLGELLSFKYGKINVLRNKIIRKHLDGRMRVDQQFIEKITKLSELAQKFRNKSKKSGMQRLKSKISQLTNERKKNGIQILQIMKKYDHLLKIRVKDSAFRSWFSKQNGFLERAGGDQSFSIAKDQASKFNFGITFNQDQSAVSYWGANQSMSILEESSITSVLYQKTKAVYKCRRLFKEKYLQRYFDCLAIRTIGQKRNAVYRVENDKCKRLLMLRALLQTKLKGEKQSSFKKLLSISRLARTKSQAMRKLVAMRQRKALALGLNQWHSQSEESIRRELRQEKSFSMQLTEQCKEASILSTVVLLMNELIQQTSASTTIEECVYSSQMKQLLASIAEMVLQQSLQSDSLVLTFQLDSQGTYLLYSHQTKEGSLQLLQRDLSELKENGKFAIPTQPTSHVKGNHFNSMQEVFQATQSNKFTSQKASPNKAGSQVHQIKMISEDDMIVQSVLQTRTAFTVGNLEDDRMLLKALTTRGISDAKSMMIIPLTEKDQTSIVGTIEIYNKENYHHFTEEDQIRFKQQVKTIGIGLETLIRHLQLLQKVGPSFLPKVLMIVQLQEARFSNEIACPRQTRAQGRSLNFYSVLQTMKLDIEKAMGASHCQIIFVPQQCHQLKKGLFFDTTEERLLSLNFRGTFFEDIVQTGQQRQVTFPSSLLLRSKTLARDSLHNLAITTYDTIQGSKVQALKYMPVTKSTSSQELVAVLEIGWQNIEEAEQVHINDSQLFKKEQMIKAWVQDNFRGYGQKLKLFSFLVCKKVDSCSDMDKASAAFNQWKELISWKLESIRSPATVRTRVLSSHGKQQECSPFSNLYLPERSALKPYTSTKKSPKFDNYEGEDLQVERAAKKKLIAAAFAMLSITNRLLKRKSLKHAIAQWRSHYLSSQVAESAFNQLLELNHKHSSARFLSATQILSRVFKKVDTKRAVICLKNSVQPRYKMSSVRKDQLQIEQWGNERTYYPQQNQELPASKLDHIRVRDTRMFDDGIFTIQDLEDDQGSDFSLGNGSKDLIKIKADSILEQARSQFMLNSNRK